MIRRARASVAARKVLGQMGISGTIQNYPSLLPSQPAAEGSQLRPGIGAFKVLSDTSQVFLSLFRMCTKCTQLHNHPEKKRQVLQAAFQNMTLFSYVCVELIPSLVLGKLNCWKDNLSYEKYNQNLDHLFFSNYIMVL